MVKENKKIVALKFFMLLAILFIAGCLSTYCLYKQKATSDTSELNKKIGQLENFYDYYGKGLKEYFFGVHNSNDGDYNYNLASWAYENGYLAEARDFCKSARETWTASNENYHKAISYFRKANETLWDDKEEKRKLLNLYIQVSNMAIDINNAMYEACEYFESACTYYLNGNYEIGDSSLEKANNKIELHDSYIKDYNSLLKELEVLEENIS